MIKQIVQNVSGFVFGIFVMVCLFYFVAFIPLLFFSRIVDWEDPPVIYKGPFYLTGWVLLYPFVKARDSLT
jgi:hypothetical protein